MNDYKRHTPFTFVLSDSIIEGDIIPVQHHGDLLQSMYLTLSDDDGIIQKWDQDLITSIEWYIGQNLIDTWFPKMPHAPKTYSEYQYALNSSSMFCPVHFSFPIPIVCLHYDKMYFRVNRKSTKQRILCHMSFVTLSDEERRDIASKPYTLHIQKHHIIPSGGQFYIHGPIKYITSSLFKKTTLDDFHLVVNGQKTSEPILPAYHSPYIEPTSIIEGVFPPQKLTDYAQTINGGVYTIRASSVHRGTNPWDDVWVSSKLDYNTEVVITSASSNTIYAYTSTTANGWISDPKLFGSSQIYSITATSNIDNAWTATTPSGWISDSSYGNVTTQVANIIAGSNLTHAWRIVSGESNSWIPDTVYASDTTGAYSVEVSTGILSAPNVWVSSNTFGYVLADGKYSVTATSNTDNAWKVFDVNPPLSFWRSDNGFGQNLYSVRMTSNNASSNLKASLTPNNLFDTDTLSGWSSNSDSNVYGFGINPGVYTASGDGTDAWKAFDNDDVSFWKSTNDFIASATSKSVTMSASSNLTDAWKVADYTETTAWRSGEMVYGRTVTPVNPVPVRNFATGTGPYGNVITGPLSFSATSNVGNVSNAISWSRDLSWRSNVSYGQIIVPQGTYTTTSPSSTLFSNASVPTLVSGGGYTGFSAWSPPISNIFCSNPIPGRYESNVSGVFDTNQIAERTITTILPSADAQRSSVQFNNLPSTQQGQNVTLTSPRIFDKYPFNGSYDATYMSIFGGSGFTPSSLPTSFYISNGKPISSTVYTFGGYPGSNVAQLTHQISLDGVNYIPCNKINDQTLSYSLQLQAPLDPSTIPIQYSNPVIYARATQTFTDTSNILNVSVITNSDPPDQNFIVNISDLFRDIKNTYFQMRNIWSFIQIVIDTTFGNFSSYTPLNDVSNFFYTVSVSVPPDQTQTILLIQKAPYVQQAVSSIRSFVPTSLKTHLPSGVVALRPFRCLVKQNGTLNMLQYGLPYKTLPDGFNAITIGKFMIGYYGTFQNPTDGIYNYGSLNIPSITNWNMGPYLSTNQCVFVMKPTDVLYARGFVPIQTISDCLYTDSRTDVYDGYITTSTAILNDATHVELGDNDYLKILNIELILGQYTIYVKRVNRNDESLPRITIAKSSFTFGYMSSGFGYTFSKEYDQIRVELKSVFANQRLEVIPLDSSINYTFEAYDDTGPTGASTILDFYGRTQFYILKITYLNRTLIVCYEGLNGIRIFSSDDLYIPNMNHVIPYNYYLRQPVGQFFSNLNTQDDLILNYSITLNGVDTASTIYHVEDDFSVSTILNNGSTNTHNSDKLYILLCASVLGISSYRTNPGNLYTSNILSTPINYTSSISKTVPKITSNTRFRVCDFESDGTTLIPITGVQDFTIQYIYVCRNPLDNSITAENELSRYDDIILRISRNNITCADIPCMKVVSVDRFYFNFYTQTSSFNILTTPTFSGPVVVPIDDGFYKYNYTINSITTRTTQVTPSSCTFTITTTSATTTAQYNRINIWLDTQVPLPAISYGISIGGIDRTNDVTIDYQQGVWQVITYRPNFSQTLFNTVNYRLTFTSTDPDIYYNNLNITRIQFIDNEGGVIQTIGDGQNRIPLTTTVQANYQYMSTYSTPLTLRGRIRGLSLNNTTHDYTINFNTKTIRNITSPGTDESVLNDGKFQNTATTWTVRSIVPAQVLDTQSVFVSSTNQGQDIVTTYSLRNIFFTSSGTYQIRYQLSQYNLPVISLNFPRPVQFNNVIIGSTYTPGFTLSSAPGSTISSTRNGNIYSFSTLSSSILRIIPSGSVSVTTPLTISNIVVYNNYTRVSPSIPDRIRTVRCGGITMTDGTTTYSGVSLESTETHRPLSVFNGRTVTFTTNVHSNVASLGTSLTISHLGGSVSAITPVNVPAPTLANEFQVRFTISNFQAGTPILINSNVLVGNVYPGGTNTSNVVLELSAPGAYNGFVIDIPSNQYVSYQMCRDLTTSAPVVGTSYSKYNFIVTESNVYTPSIYFKLTSASGIELHKDQGDTVQTCGVYPIGVYTLENCSPALFTSEGTQQSVSGTFSITYPRITQVTRILVNGSGTILVNGASITSSPFNFVKFTFTGGTNVTRVLLFNDYGLVTPRLVNLIRPGAYWVSNTVSSNVLVTPSTFGTTVPSSMNITGYTLTTTAARLPSVFSIRNGIHVLDQFANYYPTRSYSCTFPIPRTITGTINASVNELTELNSISGCSLTLYAYSSTLPSTVQTSNIYAAPVLSCEMSGPSYISALRGILNVTNPGTDTMTIDFGSNIVTISRITFSNITTTLDTPGLLYISPTNCFVSGQVVQTSDGGSYRGSMSYVNGSVQFAGYTIGSTRTSVNIPGTSTLPFSGSPDIYPYSNVSHALGGTLTISPIHTCMIVTNDGLSYGFRLNDTLFTTLTSSIVSQLGFTVSLNTGTASIYNSVTFTTNKPVSQITFFNILISVAPPKTTFIVWFRMSGTTITDVCRIEGGTAPTTDSTVSISTPLLLSQNDTQLTTFSNVCGVRITRTGLCCFSNITLYNNLGVALNTGDVRGQASSTPESFTVNFQSDVNVRRYSFYSRDPILSWTLKSGGTLLDTVTYNSNSFVYRTLTTQRRISSVTLEINSAAGYAQISDFRLYNDDYGMVSANTTVNYGSSLTGPYTFTSSIGSLGGLSPTANPTAQLNTVHYTLVGSTRITGAWRQYVLPVPVTVKQCYFYGDHRSYTLAQSNDGYTWTALATGNGDVYVDTNTNTTESRFFRFICQSSINNTTFNVDVVLCDRFGQRLNSRNADGYLSTPLWLGGSVRSGAPPSVTYTVDRPVSNVYLFDTNVSNITVNNIQTTLIVNSGGYHQFALSTPVSGPQVTMNICCIDGASDARINTLQYLGANNDPLIYTGRTMITTVPQGYYEFTSSGVRFPNAVTAKYEVKPDGSVVVFDSPTAQRDYATSNILYDADFNRLTPISTSNGYLTDVVYSGKAATYEFVQFDATSVVTSNSYTFTCDPFPFGWTLFGDGDTLLHQVTQQFQSSNVFTGLINNGSGVQSRVYKLRIDTLSSTPLTSFQISNFGVYQDTGTLHTPQCITNTTTVSRTYGNNLIGYYEGELFLQGSSTNARVSITRLPCFIRISSISVTSTPQNQNITYTQSQDGQNWSPPNPSSLSLYIKIDQGTGALSTLSQLVVKNNLDVRVV